MNNTHIEFVEQVANLCSIFLTVPGRPFVGSKIGAGWSVRKGGMK